MTSFSRKFLASFSIAFSGILLLFRSQANAQIELGITLVVIVAGFVFGISTTEWLVILLCIALVLSLEGINTAIEIFADKLHPGFDSEIGKVKDVAAGAVLIASMLVAIIGIVIFAPKVFERLF